MRHCIAADGDVDTGRGGWTLLHSAVAYGAKPEVVAALLEAGARLIPEGRSLVPDPLYIAASRAADPEVIRLLAAAMASYPPGEAREHLNAALHGAAYSNPNPAVASVLLEAGADPNERVYGGMVLHAAAETNASPALVRTLLDAGADLEACDDSGATPLHKATLERNALKQSGYGESPRALAAGADPNARGKHGWTPLMHAANTGFTILVPPLLEAGAKLNLRAADGTTALFIAALNGRLEMVDMLMKADAVPSPEGPSGSPAVEPARAKGMRIPPFSPFAMAVPGRK